MKKAFSILSVLVLITVMLVSCNAEQNVNDTVGVSFNVSSSRSLTVENEDFISVDSADLTWYYHGEKKTDTEFKTGQSASMIPTEINYWTEISKGNLLSSTKKEFSQGQWYFEVKAIKNDGAENATQVYYGKTNGNVLLTKEKRTISISVSPFVSGVKGKLVLDSVNILLRNKSVANVAPNKLLINGVETTAFDVDESENSISFERDVEPGTYTVEVQRVGEDTGVILASGSRTVVVYSGLTTTIFGSIEEDTTTGTFVPQPVRAEGTKDVVVSGSSDVTVEFENVTPSMVNGKSTTVVVPNNVLTGVTSPKLSVAVKQASEASTDNSFTASVGNAVAAVIDLTLSAGSNPVTTFSSPVKVETYVAKNLSGFSFCFPGETWTKKNSLEEVTAAKDYYYDSTEGKLTFLTDHFSSFIVETSSVAVIENMAYATLVEALDAAVAGDVVNVINDSIVILNDTSSEFSGADSSLWYDTENITLDFCGNTFTVKSNYGGSYNVLNVFGSGWTIKNGEIIVKRGEDNVDDSYSLGIEIKNGTMTIDNMTLHGGIALYDTVNATLKDTNLVMATNYYAIYLEGGASATIEGGEYKSNESKPIIYACENCEATITGGSFDGNLKGGKGSITINGGSFTDLDSAINYASSDTTITLLKDSEGKGIGSKDAGKATYREKLTIDFANHTYTMMDPAVGSTGTESQAMHWGKSLGNITMKNGTFKVAENTSGVFMAMQNYINFTAENMVFDFSSIPVVSYDEDEFSGDYAIFNGLEVPMFNNNSGKMILKNTTITMPSNSNKGLSAGGDGVEIISSIINGAINLMEESESVKVKDTTISKGVVSYFNNGSTIASSTEGEYTVYRLETV